MWNASTLAAFVLIGVFAFTSMADGQVAGQPNAATPAASDYSHVDVEVGGGYVFGGAGPSLPTYDLGVAVWPVRRWGVAMRFVRGPGHDFFPEPIVGEDRISYGPGKLAYDTFTVRYRHFTRPKLFIETGIGLMVNGHFSDRDFIYATQS